ncbi:MAG: sn-glycerol-1-phosphate dehydrogenase [Oscillospiraceae bacterium]|jgi:glycerol-1-phosphate dehydrogenase [NAD(P)+]|nr:sn-glycerol-1-phosphate dehydrogenase [Oscillospiraceae bacterium]
MAVSITYDADSRMRFEGLECGCPYRHNVPTQDVYVGAGLLDALPDMIRRKGLGIHALMICDAITDEVAGRAARNMLVRAGFTVDLCRLEREEIVDPDERSVGEALLSIMPGTEFLIAVGSGSINDITRVTAYRTGMPFVTVGTAPSMDGYMSVVAPLLLRGAKIHRDGNCPDVLVCDLDILRTAPLWMFQSGVGDVLGKYIAKADWALSRIINDEEYCPTATSIALGAADRLMDSVEEIRERTLEGTKALIEGLVLSGLTIMIIGNTRSVASVEHNIAHYWEMMKLAKGERPPSHGASVGVATRLVWPLFERFREQDLSFLADERYLAKLKASMMTRDERARWMRRAFGNSIGEQFMRENPEDFLTWEERLRRVTRAVERRKDIQAELALLPPYDRIDGVMKALGAPLTAAEIGVDAEMEKLSLRCGKDYRKRYTLMKLLDETGLLEEYI